VAAAFGLTDLEATAARAARVFLFLLPGGRLRREADEGAAAVTATTFFPLPFRRPGLHFSGAPSPPAPPAPGPPMVDMVELCSSKVEGKEEMGCDFDPGCPRHFKKSEAWDRAGIVGSVMPDASSTIPLISRHAHPREGNPTVTMKDHGCGTDGTCY
jgi:hypothetical protein